MFARGKAAHHKASIECAGKSFVQQTSLPRGTSGEASNDADNLYVAGPCSLLARQEIVSVVVRSSKTIITKYDLNARMTTF